MTGVPNPCWNCNNIDTFSTARRFFCEKCNANLWYYVIPGNRKFRKEKNE